MKALQAGFPLLLAACLTAFFFSEAQGGSRDIELSYPLPLERYAQAEAEAAIELKHNLSLYESLVVRIRLAPFNLVATLIFFMAVLHAFMASRFNRLAKRLEKKHKKSLAASGQLTPKDKQPVSFSATFFHFLGEVEAIFGIWTVPLIIAFSLEHGWENAFAYVNSRNFVEPAFVVVIMAIASTRPIIQFAETSLYQAAKLGKCTVKAWYLAILTLAPLLGSLITEPAAMTIGALLLGRYFYALRPQASFCYATLGLLFVNVSVGGTLTHFAAPPILIVAGTWEWDSAFTFTKFGCKAILGIVLANLFYCFIFRKELKRLNQQSTRLTGKNKNKSKNKNSVPLWIICAHLLFLIWTVFTLHYPALFVLGFLFFMAFAQATEHHQYQLSLRLPVLVGFFLAGLVIHGGLQAWWIAPVLSSLQASTLFFTTMVLTAFNDNAAITFLASQVPAFGTTELTEGLTVLKEGTALAQARSMQYAVVSAAIVAGGLTVIANAPNPAGQTLLAKHFKNGVLPLKLLLGALPPTLIMAAIFFFFL